MSCNKGWFAKGLKDGVPIALGYFAVAFTLGIAARNAGLTAFQAAFMSLTNVTSAGEFAGIGLIASGAAYIEMAAMQLVINLRYCLMSCTLSQKLDSKLPFLHRLLVAYGVTDEIFAISAAAEGKLNPYYTYGAACVAVPGWTIGTYLGVVLGNVMPDRLLSAMSVALYGMFIAIIIPPVRKDKIIAGLIVVSMIASSLFTYLPILRDISPGFRIIILTIVIAGIAAVLFPIETESEQEKQGSPKTG
ncbi:MAG: AzlC family ABC transporter permease [Clostridiaceae bacterium]|nr:AzlC family ABC transporter permease [Clostridiaceae bacterium]